MTFLELFAFVSVPVIVVAIGVTGAWLHSRSLQRHRNTPAE